MKQRFFLFLMLLVATTAAYAQDGGIRGKVVSRNGRAALSDVKVTVESLGLTTTTDRDGQFLFENLPAGKYMVQFATPEYEDLELMVRVSDDFIQDINPAGGKESTGLVTRFTLTPSGAPAMFPVKLRLLSELDIVKILTNTYYADCRHLTPPDEDALAARVDELAKKANRGGPPSAKTI